MSDTIELPEISEKDIIKLFNTRRAEQLHKCQEEIEAILKYYQCRLEAVTVIRNGQIVTSIQVINLPVNGAK